MERKISITTDYITLGQLLKLSNVISQGGEAKSFLLSHKILVNGEEDNRRGRKIRTGDEIKIPELNLTITLI